MLRFCFLGAALAVSTPAMAQMDPVSTGQGLVLSSTMRAHSNRIAARNGGRRGVSDARMAQICGPELARYKRQYGASDPKVQTLAGHCARYARQSARR
ncbi:hypothetical protein [Sphingosinicella sp. BN140058]|uniref:hypothetical protein n=1 Tax=Sphingosinicella sp. BN140058 TaxID=1892855 RepID=UPI0010135D84|nr:hypothetical protein [Sphingosinicella sp. BN140058]QAY76457.1 hypothetical protein ETR14_08105 [Sphingosinicella sp. BN140058]